MFSRKKKNTKSVDPRQQQKQAIANHQPIQYREESPSHKKVVISDGFVQNTQNQGQEQVRLQQVILKQQYNQKEFDKLHQQNQDLRKSVEINKQIMQQLMRTVEPEDCRLKIEELIRVNVWESDGRLKQLMKERDELQAELLIKEQIMQATKMQELQQAEMYDEQLEELKDKLERKEYVCQYKEEVWSTFERELKKVIKKDSVLYQKIQGTTQILVENLNETKISNVVKENHRMLEDQKKIAVVIDGILHDCQKIIDEEENIFKKFTDSDVNHYQLRMSNLLGNNNGQKNPQSIVLADKILKLQDLVDSITNRISILDDENSFLRSEYQRLTKQNLYFNKQVLFLQEKLKLYQESTQYITKNQPTPTPNQQYKSTKYGTGSQSSSSQQNQFSNIVYTNEDAPVGRNSLIPQQLITKPDAIKNHAGISSFTINVHPTHQSEQTPPQYDPNTQNFSDDKENRPINEKIGLKLSQIEINLNKFLNQSPEFMLKKKNMKNIRNLNKSQMSSQKPKIRVNNKPMTLEELEKGAQSDAQYEEYDDENKENNYLAVRSINKNILQDSQNEEDEMQISAIKQDRNDSPFFEISQSSSMNSQLF
ncbi:UNKNOWN [Stylonychia lemnae]|uniref:Uncharacterized protein n=1 Tax=Stylonychia lemnae TaxID=5949 RepID=A0A078A8Y8_STYLE|nr:UNKNOWN [Stylonychia lemnae]|eukprot:CDW77268.1 UNKNOWN [Stylonychia lemnae]